MVVGIEGDAPLSAMSIVSRRCPRGGSFEAFPDVSSAGRRVGVGSLACDDARDRRLLALAGSLEGSLEVLGARARVSWEGNEILIEKRVQISHLWTCGC